MQLIVDLHGRVSCLYSESTDLAKLGVIAIRRASHVETDGDGQWWADLSPIDGPSLGPFAARSQALNIEAAWIEQHWLPLPSVSQVEMQ
jgi:hypothetical protein